MKREKKSDEELVALAQAGDKRAEEELLTRYLNTVRSIARRFFMLGGDTDDLAQEGMIGLFGAIGSYKKQGEGSTFKGFASLCVFRRIVDAVKSAARKKNEALNSCVFFSDGEFLDGNDPEEALIVDEDIREYYKKISVALSDFEFKIMTMYIDGMTLAEICETTGEPFKRVDNAIQRSKRKLQKTILQAK
ncbi:MAG: sigma-70 family RNA polymerase sigma factor [Clostridia bacterium]|nr:sigma-70 family RNA polymerase sigma factor [Clostridia bacterium]